LLFFPQIISERHRVRRGYPRPPAVRQSQEQQDGPLFCAVPPLFSTDFKGGIADVWFCKRRS
jgi:hypothetical protein